MPVEVRWYLDNQIIESRYSGQISSDDIQKGVADGLKLVEGYSYPIPHIIDLSGSTSLLTKIGDYSELAAQLKQLDKRNWVIVVGVTGVAKFIASIVTQMAGLNCKMAASLEDAHTFAEHVAAVPVAVPVEN